MNNFFHTTVNNNDGAKPKSDPHLNLVLEILERNLGRQSKVQDEVARYCMFVDKLSLSLDTLLAFMKAVSFGLPDQTIQRVERLSSNIEKELQGLFAWVQRPIYGENHPIGKQIMENAKESFESNKSNIA